MTHDHECEEVQEALPWFVNGSMPDGERGPVRRHLESCDACRSDAEWLARLKQEMPERISNIPLDRDARALESLLSRVEDSQQRRQQWKLLAAASVLLAVATLVGSLLTTQLLEPRFETVTDPVITDAGSVVVQLRFSPEARIASLREILEETGATVNRGPDAEGWVTLEIPLATPGDEQDMLDKLEADPQVIAVRKPPDVATTSRER